MSVKNGSIVNRELNRLQWDFVAASKRINTNYPEISYLDKSRYKEFRAYCTAKLNEEIMVDKQERENNIKRNKLQNIWKK